MPGRGLEGKHLGDATHEVVFDYGGETHQRVGYGTIATPGGFAGLAHASQRFGRLPWSSLLAPAIDWVERVHSRVVPRNTWVLPTPRSIPGTRTATGYCTTRTAVH
jgi:hypothetical protein